MPYFHTPPLSITDLPADNRHHSDGRRAQRFIVLHHTAGTDSSAWLSTTSVPPVSCHRLIKKSGEIIKIVPDHLVAFTQGPARVKNLPRTANGRIVETVNEWALSIELENLGNGKDPYPAPQVHSAAEQCVEWWGAYGLLPIVGHGWIQTNKNDPLGFPWPDFYGRMLHLLRKAIT